MPYETRFACEDKEISMENLERTLEEVEDTWHALPDLVQKIQNAAKWKEWAWASYSIGDRPFEEAYTHDDSYHETEGQL